MLNIRVQNRAITIQNVRHPFRTSHSEERGVLVRTSQPTRLPVKYPGKVNFSYDTSSKVENELYSLFKLNLTISVR